MVNEFISSRCLSIDTHMYSFYLTRSIWEGLDDWPLRGKIDILENYYASWTLMYWWCFHVDTSSQHEFSYTCRSSSGPSRLMYCKGSRQYVVCCVDQSKYNPRSIINLDTCKSCAFNRIIGMCPCSQTYTTYATVPLYTSLVVLQGGYLEIWRELPGDLKGIHV